MHINITKSETGNNKGSCGQLVTYLEKENRLVEKLGQGDQLEHWFNHVRDNVQPYEVRGGIDNNIAKLSKDDAKFFLINISPSEKEIRYLKDRYGDAGAQQLLKAYTKHVMDAYARNFKRDNVDSGKDLVYFGKLEQHRYYTYKDLEVRKGKALKGDAKPGEQMHIQVIVSRKDASNSIKLSPLNNSKGKNAAHSAKVGQFDRVAFKQVSEQLFDKLFDYDRSVAESFKYANALKHGDYEQRQEVRSLLQLERTGKERLHHGHGKGLIETLLDNIGQYYGQPTVNDGTRKRKKRKRYSQGRSM